MCVSDMGAYLLQKVIAESAADTAILHLHHLFLDQVEACLGRFDELCVDVDRSHVVDNERDLEAVAVCKHVVQERCLARPQEPAQEGDGKGASAHRFAEKLDNLVRERSECAIMLVAAVLVVHMVIVIFFFRRLDFGAALCKINDKTLKCPTDFTARLFGREPQPASSRSALCL